MLEFESLFRTDDPSRDNFRSRLFGMFSEDIVRIWSRDEQAPYRRLERPTLWQPGERYGATLDFTLVRISDGQTFVAEQKAEMAFESYRYLRLTGQEQVVHHVGKPAFDRFLAMARTLDAFEVRVGAKPIEVHGAILVWGAMTEAGRQSVMDHYDFADVLSLEDMVNDLLTWRNAQWMARIGELRKWTDGLFDGLEGR